MDRFFFCSGCVASFVAVAAGAFAAHGLKGRISPEWLATFEVGARYQMYHAMAMLAVAWAHTRWHGSFSLAAGWCFLAGILLFSGSLYSLSLTGLLWLGAITPLGGVAFLAGWICLLLACLRPSV
jgi:uncharacterized membrane protein YgdD (TMEM256/DUF423 family)